MKSKCKFDSMQFYGGDEIYVVHRGKYTREQAIEIFDNDCEDYSDNEDVAIKEGYCRYYVRSPEWVEYDGTSCYALCDKSERGAFPVWVFYK